MGPDLRLSSLRLSQHEAARGRSLHGDVLDIGGDPKSGYHALFVGERKITFSNISASYNPDLIFDAQEKWPVEAGSYDAILMFNLLEHVFQYQAVLNNAFDALRPGGRVIGSVPFLFNVHGSPHDYFRYTGEALSKMFDAAGFEVVVIEELGTGVFSAACQMVCAPIKINLIYTAFRKVAEAADKMLGAIRPNNNFTQKYYPLGYYFEVAKRGAASD